MALFTAFAARGLARAAAGIYSVLSFHVTRRTHELGVRMALGAPRRHVLGLMLMMGGRLVLVGLAIGVGASIASTRLLRSQLFGVQAADPIAYAAVAVVLGFVAFVACYIPARRAASVDPLVALRSNRFETRAGAARFRPPSLFAVQRSVHEPTAQLGVGNLPTAEAMSA
jgi:putative ABC transport system permease protein